MDAKTVKAPKASQLLRWYDQHARELPWRAKSGVEQDPYAVWLSEIMLQQTTVVTVIPYFEDFLDRWPTIVDLARAELDDVMLAWSGLGYYSRARNLHKCARIIVSDHAGLFPRTLNELLKLPGVGPYTAAAISAIAFAQPATIVDGNVERVISRIFAIETPLPKSKPAIRGLAETLTPKKRAGDYAQAIMDLGATICTPRNPDCAKCPWKSACRAKARGLQLQLPKREKKATRPERYADIFIAMRKDGHVLIQRRPPEGLLGGLWEFPSTPWVVKNLEAVSDQLASEHLPFRAKWRKTENSVQHSFTHFHLELAVWCADIEMDETPRSGTFVAVEELGLYAMPTVMKKVMNSAGISGGKLT